MNENKREIEVSIMGKSYRVACPPEREEELVEAVAYLNNKMAELRHRMRDIKHKDSVGNRDSLLAIVALNLSHELLQINAMISSRALKAEHLSERIKSSCGQSDADNAMQNVFGMSL